ncbi:hypothetical protein BDR26DRAFT_326015 [Obelidium mucronatum]|nr:hypothetical protein BDR26DRAFT_326015 [Obelidium mucronatum]
MDEEKVVEFASNYNDIQAIPLVSNGLLEVSPDRSTRKRNIAATAEERHEHSLQTKASEDLFAYHSHVSKPVNLLEEDDLDWEDGEEDEVELSNVIEEIEEEIPLPPENDAYADETFEELTEPSNYVQPSFELKSEETHLVEISSIASLADSQPKDESQPLFGQLMDLLQHKKETGKEPLHDEIALMLLKRLERCQHNLGRKANKEVSALKDLEI